MPREEVGLALLGVGSAFGAWSALNTSPLGTVSFSQNNPEVALASMNIGLFVILGMGAGIYWLYGKRGMIPSIATAVTGIALYLWYLCLFQSAQATSTPQ